MWWWLAMSCADPTGSGPAGPGVEPPPRESTPTPSSGPTTPPSIPLVSLVARHHMCWIDADGATGCIAAEGPQAPGVPMAQVTAGDEVSCGVLQAGTVECWGDGYGFLLEVRPTGSDFVAIAQAEESAACALGNSGQTLCWDNRTIVEGPTAIDIAAASGETVCLLDPDGALWCGTDGDFEPIDVGPYSGLVGHREGMCALDGDRRLTCFDTGFGLPEGPAPSHSWAQVAVDDDHSCGLDDAGRIICWGRDTRGQVRDAPTGPGHVAIAVLDETSCAIDGDGQLVCWGWDL